MNERVEELLKQKRMFLSDDMRINLLYGLKMLIDDHVKPDSVVAEIGSFSGSSGELFALHCKELHCVDMWTDYWEINQDNLTKAEIIFDEMVSKYDNIKKVKKPSVTAALDYPDGYFDLVYIDGAHDYNNTKFDILAWLPKVKKGGVLAGHDYRYDPNIKVYEVVNEIFASSKKIESYPDSSWAIIK